MTLIVLEGYDNVGKSTLISQLKEKYKLDTMAFPTSFRKFEGDRNDLLELIAYHSDFIQDFIEHQNQLKSKSTTLILDRYFFSNIAYAEYDITQCCLDNNLSIKTIHSNLEELKRGYYAAYRKLAQPDLVINICIPPPVNAKKLADIQAYYYYNLKRYGIPFVEIEGLCSDTFSKVESILKEKNYL